MATVAPGGYGRTKNVPPKNTAGAQVARTENRTKSVPPKETAATAKVPLPPIELAGDVENIE